jgi:hypothetical protein
MGLDPEYLDGKTMVRLIKAMDNLSVNGDDSGTGRLVAEYQSQQAHKALAGIKLSGVKIKDKGLAPMSKRLTTNELLRLTFGTNTRYEDFKRESGIDERIHAEADADRNSAEFAKQLDDVRKAAKKHTKFGDESIRRTAIIARLLGHPPDGDPQMFFEKMVANTKASAEVKREAGATHEANEEEKFLASVPTSDREKFEKYVRAKYPWEMKLLEAAIKKFEEHGPEYKKATMVNFNMPFVLQKMYTPHTQYSLDGVAVDKKGRIRGKSLPKPKLAGSAMDRTYTLYPGKAYSNNFIVDMVDAFREQYRQIHVVPAANKVDAFFRDPRSVELLGGRDAHAAVVSSYRSLNDVFEGLGYSPDYKALKKLLSAMADVSKTALFAGPGRYILQYFPAVLNNAARIKVKNMDLLFTSLPKEFKLANESTLVHRIASQGGLDTNSAEFNYHVNRLNVDEDMTKRVLSDGYQAVKQFVTSGQAYGDIHPAYRAFASYYLESLRDQGVDINNIDLATEHLRYKDDPKRMKAFTHAESMVDTYMGMSYAKMLPPMLQSKTVSASLLKNLFFQLTTYSFQQKGRMANDLRLIWAGAGRDSEQVQEAAKDFVGVVAENATYQALRVYVLGFLANEGAYAFMDAMGWQYPDRDEEKEKEQRATDFLSSALYEAVPGIVMVSDQVRKIFLDKYNTYAFALAKEEDPDLTWTEWKQQGNEAYVPVADELADFAGLYGVFLRNIGATLSDIYGMWETEDGEIMVRMKDGSEKSLELNDDQKQALEFVIFTEALASSGLTVSELTRLGRKVKSETLKQIKEDNK